MIKTPLILVAIALSLATNFVRGADLDSAEAWVGTWKRTDGGQTLTISFKRDSTRCTITYSKGTPDSGKMAGDGDTIEFEGSTNGGYDHTQGTLKLSVDHTKLYKEQTVFGQDGPEKHYSAIYVRTSNNRGVQAEAEQSGNSSRNELDHGFDYLNGTYVDVENRHNKITIKVRGNKATVTWWVDGMTKTSTIHEGGEIKYRVTDTMRGTMYRTENGGIEEDVVSDNGEVIKGYYKPVR